jgi:hypothetical protein
MKKKGFESYTPDGAKAYTVFTLGFGTAPVAPVKVSVRHYIMAASMPMCSRKWALAAETAAKSVDEEAFSRTETTLTSRVWGDVLGECQVGRITPQWWKDVTSSGAGGSGSPLVVASSGAGVGSGASSGAGVMASGAGGSGAGGGAGGRVEEDDEADEADVDVASGAGGAGGAGAVEEDYEAEAEAAEADEADDDVASGAGGGNSGVGSGTSDMLRGMRPHREADPAFKQAYNVTVRSGFRGPIKDVNETRTLMGNRQDIVGIMNGPDRTVYLLILSVIDQMEFQKAHGSRLSQLDPTTVVYIDFKRVGCGVETIPNGVTVVAWQSENGVWFADDQIPLYKAILNHGSKRR